MGYDGLSPVAPARVRCLLLPCGRINLKRFEGFVRRLEEESIIHLGDVSPEASSKRNMFSPVAFPSGAILYDFASSDVGPSSRRLVPFELYRQPLIVLGVADGLEIGEEQFQRHEADAGVIEALSPKGVSQSTEQALSQLPAKLNGFREAHSSALLHRIFLFEFDSDASIPECVVKIPPLKHAKNTSLKTIMCDLTGQFLEELSSYGKSVQALPNIETPAPCRQNTLDGQSSRTGSANDLPRSVVSRSGSASPPLSHDINGERSPYRASLPSHVSSPLAFEFQPERDRSTSPVQPSRPPVTFDEINQERPTSAPATEKPRSATRVSVHGFGSGTTSERARNQARGRLGVVLGSMYLLAGRWIDAIKELVDSANIAKWSNDHAWYAKALDYILVSLLMCGWAGLDFEIPQVCYPGEKPPWNLNKAIKPTAPEPESTSTPNSINRLASLHSLFQLLPDLINHILHFYSRAATSSYSDKIPMLSFSESVIRFARLLGIIRLSHCVLDDYCLESIVNNAVPRKEAMKSPEYIESFSSRADIATLVLRAMPIFDTEDSMEVVDRLKILAAISSVFVLLGQHRKKAFILREFVTCLLPALVQSRKDDAAELGFHPAASLSVAELVTGSVEGQGVLDSGSLDDIGISAFLSILCEVYGVFTTSPSLQDTISLRGEMGDARDEARGQAIQRGFGNLVLKMDVLRWCINICEALPDLPGMLKFSSYLLTTASSGIAPGPESNDAYPTIPIEDQTRLIDTIARASTAMKQLGIHGYEAVYWDKFLIREIEVLSPNSSDLPTVRRKHELNLSGTSMTEQRNDPFIYNPSATKPPATVSEPTLLLNERTTFMVLIQNLLDVNLEIEWIRLDATADALDVLGKSLTIGPYRTQKVYLTGVAKSLGQASIVGCIAKIRGCQQRSFPIFKSAWKPYDDGKVKNIGISARLQPKERPNSVTSDPSKSTNFNASREPVPSSLLINVIKNQPILEAKSRTLSQSAVMVLLGQSRIIPITLMNKSSENVDFIMISFTDSTTSLLQATIENKDLSPSDLYETEYLAYHRPALRLAATVENRKLSLSPGSELSLPVEVFGKPGLVHGAMQISYAHLGVPKDELEDKVYTRQLIVPISVTVNATVELIRTEVMPFVGKSAWLHKEAYRQQSPTSVSEQLNVGGPCKLDPQASIQTPQTQPEIQEKFLLVLDFHNAWPRPITISLQAKQGKKSSNDQSHETSTSVQPGHSTRLMVPMPRVTIKHCYSPIPAINPANKRQFVLNSSKVSAEVENLGREVFWYREEVLGRLRATWREQELDRFGEINLRTMRLTPRMLDLMKLDAVEVDVSLYAHCYEGEEKVKRLDRSLFQSYVDVFAKVLVRIYNRSTQPIHPLLRLQPSLRNQPYNVALDLSRKVAFNGLLQRPLPSLMPYDTHEITLGIVFLCAGEYEIGARVEELRPWKLESGQESNRDRATTGGLSVSGLESTDRGIWYSKRPCLIDIL